MTSRGSRSSLSLALGVLVVLTLAGGAIAKTIKGTAGANVLRGTNAADVLTGLAGNDRLYGRGGNDRLLGGTGNDRLEGGAGRDVVNCGPGRDVAVVDASDAVSGCETVRRTAAGPPAVRLGPLGAGVYTAAGPPRARLTLGPGWTLFERGSNPAFVLTRPVGDSFGRFMWFNGTPPGATLDDLVRIARPRITARAPVTISGASGERIDVTGPVGAAGSPLTLAAEESARHWYVNVRGQPTLIVARAPTASFSAFVAEVERVLATVVFEG